MKKLTKRNFKGFNNEVEKILKASGYAANVYAITHGLELNEQTKLKNVWDGETNLEIEEEEIDGVLCKVTTYAYNLNENVILIIKFKFLEEKENDEEEYELNDLVEILEVEII